MNIEIEHKYLVKDSSFKTLATESHIISQGYLSREKNKTIRIRTIDNKGFITIKTKTILDSRKEFEYEIPYSDAADLLTICEPPVLKKIRHIVPFEGFIWEIDEFLDELQGITLAEIELPKSNTKYDIPSFIGENVTNNPNYYNSNIHTLTNKLNR